MTEWRGARGLEGMLVPVGSLAEDGRNVRRHPERSVAALAESLRRFGQRKPLVARGGVVVAGNGTLAAARRLGWERVAVVDADDLTEDEARAYSITDNRAQELSEWDRDALAEALSLVGDASALGFTEDEVRDFVEESVDPFVAERVSVDRLRVHPRNYQTHSEDQLAHIVRSIEEHGFYRNVVVARDDTILAGHGVVLAARRLGKRRVPVIRLDLDPNEPRALKVLTSDNEIGNLAETDDRALTELLKEIMGTDGLEGTGYTEARLAALAFVTRPASEMQSENEAAAWVGMPEYDAAATARPLRVIMSFASAQAREEFYALIGARPLKEAEVASMWWPPRGREDVQSVRFVEDSTAAGGGVQPAGRTPGEDAPPAA